jgi:hypothetical protein
MVMLGSHYFDPSLTLQKEEGKVMKELERKLYDFVDSPPPSVIEQIACC